MKIKRLILTTFGVVSALVSALASPQFIQHRQDAFKAVPTSKGQVIFLGNSITNFHNWADAFVRPDGLPIDESLISNRGISDERAYHWKHNVQMMLDGEDKPAKIFIGIGTNDLNVGLPPEVVVNDIRAIIRQIQVSSPSTEIHVQSILPRTGAINDVVMRTIPLIEAMAAEMDVDFINLTETMEALGAPGSWTYEGLHPTGVGYRAWCRFIAPKVGFDCAYLDGDINTTGGFTNCMSSVHAGQYSIMPVHEDEILILGDAWTDAVQWHEFFGNAKVKSRSIGNGTNLTTAQFKALIDRSLKSNNQQKCPKAIVLCWGAVRTGTNLRTESIKSDYESLVAYAQAAAPNAKIIVCQTPPTSNDGHSANAEISKITSVPVVDLEAKGMTVGTASDWNMAQGLGARGVLYAAQAVGEVLNNEFGAETVKIPSTADFETRYANRNRRIEVAKCFNALYQYRLEPNKDLTDAIAQIEEILAGNTVTEAQVAEAQSIRDKTLNGLQFTIDTEKWYHISSPRNYEGANASVASICHSGVNPFLVDKKLSATATDGSDIWAFRQRPDGTYDILSYDGYYLVPGNSISASRAYPTEGWTIEGGSAETGTYIIGCGEVYLHRNQSNNLVNYWQKGDTGCDFYITEYPGELPELDKQVSNGWITMKVLSGHNVAANGLTGKDVINNPSAVVRGNGYYEMTMDSADPEKTALAFFSLTIDDNNAWTIRGLSGHKYNNQAIAFRNSAEASIDPVKIDDTTYTFPWAPFRENGVSMMGKFGDNKIVMEVLPATVENFDVWSVNIIAVEPDRVAKDIVKDTNITLDIPANKGIKTVYDGGFFFLEPGTVFTADDLVVECENIDNQSQDHPDVVIDTNSKTITVDYSAGLPNGWYTFELHSISSNRSDAKSWFNTAVSDGMTSLINTEGIYRQNATNYYPLALEQEPENNVARQYFYLTSTGDDVYNIRTLHGIYLTDAATASYNPIDLTTPPHATEVNVFKTTFMVWEHNLNTGNDSYTYLAGKFNGSYTYYTIKPADTESFDIYEVRMIEGYRGAAFPDDASVTFNSEDNHGICCVHENGTFFVTKGFNLKPEMLTASSIGDNKPRITVEPGVITVDYSPVPLESIELDRESVELEVGATLTIKATINPEYVTNPTIYWSSSDEEVATVDENGLVTAVGAGTATISAFQGEISASCEVTVTTKKIPDPVEITLPEYLPLKEGQTSTLNPDIKNAPEGAVVIWTSSDPEVATVSTEGVVTAVAEGTATITATCGDATASCTVTVTKDVPPVVNAVSVTLSSSATTLEIGQTFELTATVTPEDTTDKTITWTSSDPEVATVSTEGVVTAVAEGTATITAACGDATASCIVTVNAKPVVVPDPVEITISDEALTLTVGDTYILTAKLSNAPEGASVTWSSDKEIVATVAADGKVTALAAGTATITASYGEISAACLLTVTPKEDVNPDDSINEINADGVKKKVYDIHGRRVIHPSNGIYIQNGKKVVIKK